MLVAALLDTGRAGVRAQVEGEVRLLQHCLTQVEQMSLLLHCLKKD